MKHALLVAWRAGRTRRWTATPPRGRARTGEERKGRMSGREHRSARRWYHRGASSPSGSAHPRKRCSTVPASRALRALDPERARTISRSRRSTPRRIPASRNAPRRRSRATRCASWHRIPQPRGTSRPASTRTPRTSPDWRDAGLRLPRGGDGDAARAAGQPATTDVPYAPRRRRSSTGWDSTGRCRAVRRERARVRLPRRPRLPSARTRSRPTSAVDDYRRAASPRSRRSRAT